MRLGDSLPDETRRFTASIDHLSLGMSLATALLGLAGVDPDGLPAASAWLVLLCADDIPNSFDDVGQTFEFGRCLVSEAIGGLLDPAKALGAATEQFGDAIYAEGGLDALERRAAALRVLGAVFELGSLVHAIWAQMPDAISQMGNDRPGDVILHLTSGSVEEKASPPLTLPMPQVCDMPAAAWTQDPAVVPDWAAHRDENGPVYAHPETSEEAGAAVGTSTGLTQADITGDKSTDWLLSTMCSFGGTATFGGHYLFDNDGTFLARLPVENHVPSVRHPLSFVAGASPMVGDLGAPPGGDIIDVQAFGFLQDDANCCPSQEYRLKYAWDPGQSAGVAPPDGGALVLLHSEGPYAASPN